MQFERARAEDAPRVLSLVRQAYARWVPVIGRKPMPMTVDYEQAIREHEIDLVHVDGHLVALIETIMHPDHLFIENIAVGPAHQGKGLGRQLLAHAERKSAKARLPQLRLLTNSAFEANVRLYQSVGFQIDRTEPFMGGTTVHMSKMLPA